MDPFFNAQGWNNRSNGIGPNPGIKGNTRVRTRIFRLDSFRIPSFTLSFIGACSLAFGICNVVIACKFFFKNPVTFESTTSWFGCMATGPAMLTPNSATNAAAFWFFASVGIWIGLWCFLLGIWAGYSPSLNRNMLRALYILLAITFIGVAVQFVLAILDIIATFSCLYLVNMKVQSYIKPALPIFLVIFAIIQMILAAILFNLVQRLTRFRNSEHSMVPSLPKNRSFNQQMPDGMDIQPPNNNFNNNPNNNNVWNNNNNINNGFNNRMAMNNPSPYTNFQGFGQ